MRAVVVYESMFGNTERVAQAVADGLRGSMEVDLVEAGAAIAAGRPDLLVVGGPTQGFSLSRKAAGGPTTKVPPGRPPFHAGGIRSWIETLPRADAPAFAAFDTRFRRPRWLTGSAARATEKRLRAKGYAPAAPAQSFFVAHSPGPLLQDELGRARAWSADVATRVARPAAA